MAQRKTATKAKATARKSGRTASHKPKSSSTKSCADRKTARGVKGEVTIDRRRGARRENESIKSVEAAVAPACLERRKKVNRRRQIDPTTCERDYTDDEIQFMSALDEYKRTSGRMFPTCSEVLEVVRNLGYVRLSASELAARTPSEASPVEIHANPLQEFHGAASLDEIR